MANLEKYYNIIVQVNQSKQQAFSCFIKLYILEFLCRTLILDQICGIQFFCVFS